MTKQPAVTTRKGNANVKKSKKRKRFGKTGTDTRQAKISQRAVGGARPARKSARSRLLLEIRSLASAAVEALDAGDLAKARTSLMAIATSGDK